jgi:hypothetical protein
MKNRNWELANMLNRFGLENRQSSEIINDDISVPFFLFSYLMDVIKNNKGLYIKVQQNNGRTHKTCSLVGQKGPFPRSNCFVKLYYLYTFLNAIVTKY